ncbi:MAG: exonuclease SbcCD subunit D [Clostridiales bacterium]|nr:exonuclease SbcCD subunit D [Clostridiales bacterium]
MKIFHLSDLHIGKQFYHYSMVQEQRHILGQVVALVEEEKPDAVILAGDIYDSAIPSAEAVSVFDAFLTALCKVKARPTVLMIAGNHDSAKRLDFARSILAEHRVYIAGLPPMEKEEFIQRVTLEDAYGEVDFYLLPFVKPSYVRGLLDETALTYNDAVRGVIAREEIDESRRNVLVSHQFYTASGSVPKTCDSEIRLTGGIENVDVGALECFDYAALGHIHRPQKIGKEHYRYCGTLLPYSVSEAEDEKSVTVVELFGKGEPLKIRTLPLSPLRGVRRLTGTLAEVLQKGECFGHDYVSITLTDEVEAYEPKVRLEEKFNRILEIRIDNARTRKLLDFTEEVREQTDPYEAFVRFFEEMNGRKMTEAEEKILQETINREMEEGVQ